MGFPFWELLPGPPVFPELPEEELPGPPFSGEPVVAMAPGASVTLPGLEPEELSGAVGLIVPEPLSPGRDEVPFPEDVSPGRDEVPFPEELSPGRRVSPGLVI